jgi:hypothetical protein
MLNEAAINFGIHKAEGGMRVSRGNGDTEKRSDGELEYRGSGETGKRDDRKK